MIQNSRYDLQEIGNLALPLKEDNGSWSWLILDYLSCWSKIVFIYSVVVMCFMFWSILNISFDKKYRYWNDIMDI